MSNTRFKCPFCYKEMALTYDFIEDKGKRVREYHLRCSGKRCIATAGLKSTNKKELIALWQKRCDKTGKKLAKQIVKANKLDACIIINFKNNAIETITQGSTRENTEKAESVAEKMNVSVFYQFSMGNYPFKPKLRKEKNKPSAKKTLFSILDEIENGEEIKE